MILVDWEVRLPKPFHVSFIGVLIYTQVSRDLAYFFCMHNPILGFVFILNEKKIELDY